MDTVLMQNRKDDLRREKVRLRWNRYTKILFGRVPLFSNCKLRDLSNSYLRFHSEASACEEAFPSAACLSAFATANK